MSIVNKAEGIALVADYGTGIYNNSKSPILEDISIHVERGNTRYGIYCLNAQPVIDNVDIRVLEGVYGYGVYITDPLGPDIIRSKIVAQNATTQNAAVYIVSSVDDRIRIEESYLEGWGNEGYGIFLEQSVVSGTTTKRSMFKGSTTAMTAGDAYVRVTQSTLYGGVTGTRQKCVACDDDLGNALSPTCQ
jgi:hypothetical protein